MAVIDPVSIKADGRLDEEVFLRALGKRVRLLRLVRELRQDELAQAAGMSRSFVSLIEKGTHGVDVVRLLRLAAAFGMPLTELLNLTTTAVGMGVRQPDRSGRRPPVRLATPPCVTRLPGSAVGV